MNVISVLEKKTKTNNQKLSQKSLDLVVKELKNY